MKTVERPAAPVPAVADPLVAGAASGAEVGAGVADHRADGAAERRTRDAVVSELLAAGPMTAAALADRLSLSPAGVRRHLDQLTAEGAVRNREAHHTGPRGRGRPARAYVLTEAGRARLPHAYDDLAIRALEFLSEQGGPAAVEAFARRRAEALVSAAQERLDLAGDDVPARVQILAETLTGQGYAASVQQIGIGDQLCQHHCPVAHVATRFPQLCEQELSVLTRSLGTYAQRLATIARGDSFCTTFIPLARVQPPPPDAPARISPAPGKSHPNTASGRISS